MFTFPPEHVWSEISETVMALIFVPGIITYKKILCFCVSVHLFRSQMTGGAKLVKNEKGGTRETAACLTDFLTIF